LNYNQMALKNFEFSSFTCNERIRRTVMSKHLNKLSTGAWQSTAVLGACLFVSGVVTAQDHPPASSTPNWSLPAATGTPLPGVKANDAMPPASSLDGQASDGRLSSTSNAGDAPSHVRRITLEEAQQMAAGAADPLVRLGQLQVEIAKQHRLGVRSQYFPSIGTTFLNDHLNKQTGQVLTIRRPRVGGFLSVPVNVVAKNQTVFDVNAVQPVTPLFAIHQLVKIARADENIARAKAGMPVVERASKVEKNYFDLLVAERELISAEAEAKKIQAKWLTASSSGAPKISAEQESDMIAAEKAVALPASKVKELTASLVGTLGLPEGVRLELVAPEPLVEDLSLDEVAGKAAAANPEVVEAEQTALKAHAGFKLSKMSYFPTVAIIGGYANQNLISNAVLPKDFSYIGVVGTWTLFDFGKREHGVKEVKAQSEAADLAVQLTKAKVAQGVKSGYLELERSRKLCQLARRMVSATQVIEASYKSDDPEVESARARMEADMFRAELEYRQAYARVKSLVGDK
jgi:outer membrane protein TolC